MVAVYHQPTNKLVGVTLSTDAARDLEEEETGDNDGAGLKQSSVHQASICWSSSPSSGRNPAAPSLKKLKWDLVSSIIFSFINCADGTNTQAQSILRERLKDRKASR